MYFTVGLSEHTTFLGRDIIKFDRILTNVGGGYIGDVNNADYGKFIALKNGTYQFNAVIYSKDDLVAVDLLRNEELITVAHNGGPDGGSASLAVVLDLKEGDQVYFAEFVGVT